MVVDVLRSYWDIANGLGDVTRQRATATAKALLSGDVGATPIPGAFGQVQSLTEELIALSAANRELLRGFVSAEVDRALQAVGAATRDEVTALRRSNERLTRRVAALEEAAGSTAAPARAARSPVKKPARKKPAPRPPASDTATPAASGPTQPGPAKP